MTQIEQAIRNVTSWPRRVGKAELLKHMTGERLTRDEAIRAKCFDCVCGGDDKPDRCTVIQCALTAYCPWNRKAKGNDHAEPEDSDT